MTRRPAYSYIRFSSGHQKLGDSLRRQVASAELYAKEHDLLLDTHSYRDLGVSAFKGQNAVQGKLGTFLRAVDAGVIPNQSMLLVESLDRLSRRDVDDALELFLSIIRRGVTLVTLTDGQIYSTESIKRDRGISLIISILVMMRAHEESAIKGERIKAAWKDRAAKGGIFTRSAPSWLELRADGWAVLPERAHIIQGIFEMYLDGTGMPTIAKQLNDAEIGTFGRSPYWRADAICYLLHHPAVYGQLEREQCQEPPVPGYYPAIIEKTVFDRVTLLSKSKLKARRDVNGPCFLFSTRGTCQSCGDKMRKISGRGHGYRLQCDRAFHRGNCFAPAISGLSADMAFFQEVATGKVMLAHHDDAAVIAAKQSLAVLQDQLLARRADRQELLERALAGSSMTPMAKRIATLEKSIATLEEQANVQRKNASPDYLADFSNVRHLCVSILSAGTPLEDKLAYQLQLRGLLGRVVEAVSFDAALLQMTLTFKGGTSSVLALPRLSGAFRIGNKFYQQHKPRQAAATRAA